MISFMLVWFLAFINSLNGLEFDIAGNFKILQLTDLHFGKHDEINLSTISAMRKLIKLEKPDLVVLTGDIVSGNEYDHTSTWFESRWRQAVMPMEETHTKYAVVLGNHDVQASLYPEDIIEYDMTFSSSETRKMAGVKAANYYIDVGSTYRLWFFNTNDNRCNGKHSWGCVENDVIDWATSQSKINQSIVFAHIPQRFFVRNTPINRTGTKNELVSFPIYDNHLLEFARYHNVIGWYHGHDHGNDYVGYIGKILIGYGRKSGYGGYNTIGMEAGARVIVISNTSNSLDTWIRLVDGDILINKPFHDVHVEMVSEYADVILMFIFFILLLFTMVFHCAIIRPKKHVHVYKRSGSDGNEML